MQFLSIRVKRFKCHSFRSYRRYVDPESNNEPAVREQHFYREGNAEVLQLMTRGQVEDDAMSHRSHYPTTLIVDGKDVLLQRFMQDQKARHEHVSMQEPEVVRTVESHHRLKNLYQQEVILLPEELELRSRRHGEEMASSVQKMEDAYEEQKMDAESHIRDVHRQEISIGVVPGISDRPTVPKEQTTTYAFHDLELARQNALLTRLLLERETRHVGGAMMMDAASYLETQSLPGQVAIATQTDRAAATQTERQVRSRSDNDESDEESRSRKKIKTKKRYGEGESKRTRMTLWMKSPIEEEESERFDKRLNILRKKVKEVKEGRRVSLEPEVLREISDSLDENGSSYPKGKLPRAREKTSEESSVGYKVLGGDKNGSSSSTEVSKQRYETDDKRAEISSSPEISVDNGEYVRETMEKKSSRKESRVKKQKKVESVIKPSFRVLEREITMLTKKLSKLADKKTQKTTEDDSTSREKSKTSKDSKRDSEQRTSRTKADERKRSETSPCTSKETVATRTRQKFKYQQQQIMSPGSSEYDDTFEKPKKSKVGPRQEVTKHKQTSSRSHTKIKRQTQTQIERKEQKRKIEQQDAVEKRKDGVSKENGASDSKPAVKLSSRMQKLAAIGRREKVLEEPSTSTSSDRVDGKKDSFASRDSDKKSAESSDVPSIPRHVDQRESKRKLDRVSEKFTDDFVTKRQSGDIDQESALRSMTGASKGDTSDGAGDAEVIQQFSDDFTLDTRTKDVEQKTPVDTEGKDESGHGVSHDFGKEHVTLREVAEDVAVLRDLGYAPLEDESALDAAGKQQTELLETPRERTVPLGFAVQEAPEEHRVKRLTFHCGKCADRAKLADTTTRYEDETCETWHQVEKATEREEEGATPEKDAHEHKVLKDAEESAKKEADRKGKRAESPEESSDSTKHTEQPEEEEKIGTNGLHSGTDVLPSKTDEDSRDIKDVTSSSHSNGEGKAVESRVNGKDERSRHESKEHSEEKTLPSTESIIDVVRRVAQELIPKEIEDASLREIKGEEKARITATDTDGHQVVAEKPEETSKERTTSESDSERLREDEELTIEIFEGVSDISQPSKSDSTRSFDIHPEPLVKGSGETLMNVDEAKEEVSTESLVQTEPEKTTDIAKEDADADKVKHDPTARTEMESRETEEEPHASPPEPLGLRKTKLDESGEIEFSASVTEVAASRREVADTEQPQAECIEKTKEESHGAGEKMEDEQPQAERTKKTEEESSCETHKEEEKKEELHGAKEKMEDEETSDKLREQPRDSELEKSAVDQPDTADAPETVVESVASASSRDQDRQEQRADVSDPIFSSFIDTLEVSEESDSSSDVSRKTTLTTRPYDTPRHRQKWQQQESLEIAVMPEAKTVDDESVATAMGIEAEEDTDSNVSLDEIESAEDSTTIDAPIDERTEDAGIASERFLLAEKIGEEKLLSVSGAEKMSDGDGGFKSKFEEVAEPGTSIKAGVKEALTTLRDKVSSILDVTGPRDPSKEKTEDESVPMTKKECTSESVTPHRKIEEASETVKLDGKSEIRSSAKQVERVSSKADGASVGDAKEDETKAKDAEVGETRNGVRKTSSETRPSISARHAARKETSDSPVKKKKPERSKAASPVTKKRVLDEEPEGKATWSRRRSRKDIDGDPEKRKRKDIESQKQSRREEEPQRKQVLPRTRPKVDKRQAAAPAKIGEIDTSKTRSKYMAWYNKNREEGEKKKKLEKKVAEDEEQLPRWVSRGLKHRAAKPRGKEHGTPEMTPRTRRKIKPLVNVESEQLKAIVRQGRELRRAEGKLRQDPPVQIFARTPPVSTSDAQQQQHRLLQHSEYKYEKVPFYLHPPPAPHPSPQLSPERSFEVQPSTSQCGQSEDEPRTAEVVQSVTPSGRLRHQQLLEKKSVFDIAYSEAAPSQLRSDSATPPS